MLLVDDILSNGQTLLGLLELTAKAHASVAGVAVAIEKAMRDGAGLLRRMDLRVESLAVVEGVQDGRILLA